MPPVTDPHQLLVLAAARASGIAFSALPDAPVLPVTESRRARLGRVLTAAGARLPAPGRRRPAPRPAVTAAPCR